MRQIAFVFLLMSLLSSTLLFAQNNKMLDTSLQFDRCKGDISAEVCKMGQNRAYQESCISYEEWKTGQQQSKMPICVGTKFLGWCMCGCFHPDTEILSYVDTTSPASYVPIRLISEAPKNFQVYGWARGSKILAPIARKVGIKGMTNGPEDKPLVVIKTDRMPELSVTTEHPVLLSTGEMVAAKTLKVGQQLVDQSGKLIQITQIENKMTDLDVVNLMTDSADMISHLVVAQGIMTGDLAWQNSMQSEEDALLLRE